MKLDQLMSVLIPPVASLVIKLIGLTLRLEIVGREHLQQFKDQGQPVLFVFWHNRLLYTCYYLRKEGLTMMISKSRDGELIARVAKHFGIDATRGSSSRDGLRAVAELANIMQNGKNGGITPDGPRGPKYHLQLGALMAAKKANVPVLPVSINFARKKEFQSWDRFRVPYPFSRAVLIFGAPFRVPADTRGDRMDQLRMALEERLQETTKASDRYFS
jgi:lysophospholipid acyltransferase (LPLAT)-like uncharacterized protein